MQRKKRDSRLTAVCEMLRKEVPMYPGFRGLFIRDIQKLYNCSWHTAYYYYYYRAEKILKKEGLTVIIERKKLEPTRF